MALAAAVSRLSTVTMLHAPGPVLVVAVIDPSFHSASGLDPVAGCHVPEDERP
jgi:hypothetical protein